KVRTMTRKNTTHAASMTSTARSAGGLGSAEGMAAKLVDLEGLRQPRPHLGDQRPLPHRARPLLDKGLECRADTRLELVDQRQAIGESVVPFVLEEGGQLDPLQVQGLRHQ